MGSNTVTVTDKTFGETIAATTPTLVDFWAEWCGPCKMIAPALEEIAADHAGKVTIAKLNVDENPQTAMEHDVMSIPTLILFHEGIEKKRLVGARPKHAILEEIREFIA